MKTLIIAEAGVNHNGNLKLAYQLIDAAAAAGADAVKFQSFRADALVVHNAPKARYQIRNTRDHGAQWKMLKKLELSESDHRHLLAHARQRKITFLSTPFDEEHADLLNRLGIRLFKISSGEITNKPLIDYIAGKGKPIILSTGMSSLNEVGKCVHWIQTRWKKLHVKPSLSLLHCVSNYPARVSDCNLRAMKSLANTFHLPVGYSDHTPGIEIAIAAVALGARIIEKHLTMDNRLPGPDHRASLEPEAFKQMVQGIRNTEKALGDGRKRAMPNELEIQKIARRSLVSAQPLPKGSHVRGSDLSIKRPGTGIPPEFIKKVIGMTVKRDIDRDTVLNWKDLRDA